MADKTKKTDYKVPALGFFSATTLGQEDPSGKEPPVAAKPAQAVEAGKNKGGRPREGRDMVRFSLYIDQETAGVLRKRSEDTGAPVNKIMLRALKEYLQNSSS
jgi:hypothetical protein